MSRGGDRPQTNSAPPIGGAPTGFLPCLTMPRLATYCEALFVTWRRVRQLRYGSFHVPVRASPEARPAAHVVASVFTAGPAPVACDAQLQCAVRAGDARKLEGLIGNGNLAKTDQTCCRCQGAGMTRPPGPFPHSKYGGVFVMGWVNMYLLRRWPQCHLIFPNGLY